MRTLMGRSTFFSITKDTIASYVQPFASICRGVWLSMMIMLAR